MTGSEHAAAIRQSLRRKVAEDGVRKSGPDLRWAQSILEKSARGEAVAYRSLELARQALGIAGSRTPGEDDE